MTTWILTIIPIIAIWFVIRIMMKFRRLQYENKD